MSTMILRYYVTHSQDRNPVEENLDDITTVSIRPQMDRLIRHVHLCRGSDFQRTPKAGTSSYTNKMTH
jgi:hypothetical protein